MARRRDGTRFLQIHSVDLGKLSVDTLAQMQGLLVTLNVPNLVNVSTIDLPEHTAYPLQNQQYYYLAGQNNIAERGLYQYDGTDLVKQVELLDEVIARNNTLRQEIFAKIGVKFETENVNISGAVNSLPSFPDYTPQENDGVFLVGQDIISEIGLYRKIGANLVRQYQLFELLVGNGFDFDGQNLNAVLKPFTDSAEATNLLRLDSQGFWAEHFIHSDSTGNLSYLPDPARNNKLGLHLSTSGLTGQPPTIDGRVVFERKTGLAEIGFKDVVKITARGANFGNNATFAFPQLEKYFEVDTTYSLGNFTNGYYRHENAGSDILEAYIKVKETQPEGLVNNIEIRLFAGSQFTTDFFDFTFQKFSFADFVFADSRIDSPLTDPSFNYLAKDFTATIDLEQSHHAGIQDFTLSVNNNEGSVNITQNDGTKNLVFETTPSIITDDYSLTLNINDKFGNAIARQVDLLRVGNYIDELVEFVPESTATHSHGSVTGTNSMIWAESKKELRGQGSFEYDGSFASDDVFNLGLTNLNLSNTHYAFGSNFSNTWISVYHSSSNRNARLYESGELKRFYDITTPVNMKIVITKSVNYFLEDIQRYNSSALPPFPSVIALGLHWTNLNIIYNVDARNIRIKGDWVDRTI